MTQKKDMKAHVAVDSHSLQQRIENEEQIAAVGCRLDEIRVELDELNSSVGPCACVDGAKETLEIRLRTFSKSGKHYVRQCMICGCQRGTPLKPTDALSALNGEQLKDFDESIEASRRTRNELRQRDRDRLMVERIELERFIQEATGAPLSLVAQIFMERGEQQKAADRFFKFVDETTVSLGVDRTMALLGQAMARHKKPMWEKHKKSVNRFDSEDALKAWIESNLSKDFLISKHVVGRHLGEGVKVVIDYIFVARAHLIEFGFDPAPFGIEVKHIPQEDGFMHKASRGLWQTISYNDCAFDVDGTEVRPKFSLIFSNLSFEDERRILRDFDFAKHNGDMYDNDKIAYEALLHLANHARVGSLEIKGTPDNFRGWDFRFAGGHYFSSRLTSGEWTYRKSDENVINKLRIGNADTRRY